MEITQSILNSLLTPNELAITIITSLLTFLEAFVIMLLFTALLNITGTRKQKAIYVVSISAVTIISRFILPFPFGTLANVILLPIIVAIVFRVNALKAILALIIPFVITTILETLSSRLFIMLFQIPYEHALTIPLYRTLFMLFTYACLYGLSYLARKFNLNINLLDNISKRNKKILISVFILGTITIALQLYITFFYSDLLPTSITLISILILLAYFLVSFYVLSKTMKLEAANQKIENLQQYNKTLTILHDNIRAFKHDFNNIVQAIGGYVATSDINGLSTYYNGLLKDCQNVNNLTALSPDLINNPSIYSILASKYHIADGKGIAINLNVFLDLNTLRIGIYEFTRILGILLDNSIEAAQECENRIINIEFRNEPTRNRQLVIVENTFKDKNVDIEKIFEKAHTSKENHTGLGLWEVRQILKKNTNLNLYTTKKNNLFIQQLEIY